MQQVPRRRCTGPRRILRHLLIGRIPHDDSLTKSNNTTEAPSQSHRQSSSIWANNQLGSVSPSACPDDDLEWKDEEAEVEKGERA